MKMEAEMEGHGDHAFIGQGISKTTRNNRSLEPVLPHGPEKEPALLTA